MHLTLQLAIVSKFAKFLNLMLNATPKPGVPFTICVWQNARRRTFVNGAAPIQYHVAAVRAHSASPRDERMRRRNCFRCSGGLFFWLLLWAQSFMVNPRGRITCTRFSSSWRWITLPVTNWIWTTLMSCVAAQQLHFSRRKARNTAKS